MKLARHLGAVVVVLKVLGWLALALLVFLIWNWNKIF